MECGRHRRKVCERRPCLEAGHVAECPTVAHPRKEQASGIHVPPRTDRLEDAPEVGRVGVRAHQCPGAPDRCRRHHNGATAARIAQPAPEKLTPGSAAAMQRHDKRPGAVAHIVLRNIEPEPAPFLLAELHDAGVVLGESAEETGGFWLYVPENYVRDR